MRRFQLAHGVLQLGQGTEGIAQARQVSRTGIAQADTGEDALNIADFLELRLQLFEAVAVQQAADRVLACLQHLEVAQRAVQPARQEAAGHGGLAAVDHRLQGVVATTGQVDVQLQVTAAGAVEDHRVVQALVAQAAQVRQGRALGFLGVGQQAAGGTDGQGQLVAAKALEILRRELLAQGLARRIAVEVPRRAATGTRALLGGQVAWPVVGDQQLYRVQALELGQQVFPAFDLLHAEVAAGDVQNRQAKQAFIAEQGGNQVVAAFVEQGLVTHRAGVMMRTTWRSTGPLLVAGSPICSQITTDSPSFTSLAR